MIYNLYLVRILVILVSFHLVLYAVYFIVFYFVDP